MHKLFAVIFVLVLLWSSQDVFSRETPVAKKGIIDLSDWDFKRDGNIALDGEWEFYWEEVLTPITEGEPCPEYLWAPQAWSAGKGGYPKFPSFGYASYRLNVVLPKKEEYALKLFFPKIHTAARLWANGEVYYEFGQVGTSAETEVPGSTDMFYLIGKDLVTKSDTLELIFNISNHRVHGSYQGIIRSIELGESHKMILAQTHRKLFDATVIGMLLIIGIYHLLLFFYRKKDLSTLIFTFLAFAFAIRGAYTADLLYWVALWNYELGWKTAYIIVPIYPVLMYLFFRSLFPEEIHAKLSKYFWGISSVFLLVIFFFKSPVISRLDSFLGMYSFLSLVYLTYVGVLAFFRKRQGAEWALFGMLFFFIAAINDFLHATGIIQSVFIAMYGMLGYVVFQAANLGSRFAIAFQESEKLAAELDFKNRNLEEIVDQRTQEVQQQHQQISERNEELKQTNEEILAQRDEISVQKTEIELKNLELNTINEDLLHQRNQLDLQHRQINASLRYALTIQEAILPRKDKLDKAFAENELIYRPKDIVSGDYYWFNSLPRYKDLSAKKFAAVVDCTGHGVPGAFMSLIGSRLMNEIVYGKKVTDLAEILEQLDAGIRESLKQDESENKDGMDVCLCRLEERANDEVLVSFAGAKRPFIYFSKAKGKVEILKGGRRSIGGVNYWKKGVFAETELLLQKGDVLYLTSDGYIDQNGPVANRIGTPKFLQILEQIKELPIRDQRFFLEEILDNHQGGFPQRDDITVWIIRL